jgi:hypothetical protein
VERFQSHVELSHIYIYTRLDLSIYIDSEKDQQ